MQSRLILKSKVLMNLSQNCESRQIGIRSVIFAIMISDLFSSPKMSLYYYLSLYFSIFTRIA